ncbi:hypothetical protein SAMN05216371_7910 [Streptomyces sp. TLI_053]|nr:hypothetical protein SAMN05216371_7910 [Streptomyces sp. TLI_053]
MSVGESDDGRCRTCRPRVRTATGGRAGQQLESTIGRGRRQGRTWKENIVDRPRIEWLLHEQLPDALRTWKAWQVEDILCEFWRRTRGCPRTPSGPPDDHFPARNRPSSVGVWGRRPLSPPRPSGPVVSGAGSAGQYLGPESQYRQRSLRTSPLTDAPTVEAVDHHGLLPVQQVAVGGGQRCQGVDQDLTARNVDRAARPDPASRAPGESDATLEAGGFGRAEAVHVGPDRLVANGAEPADAVEDRPAVTSLAPGLPARGCSSSRHGDHSASTQPRLPGAGGLGRRVATDLPRGQSRRSGTTACNAPGLSRSSAAPHPQARKPGPRIPVPPG